MATAADSYSAVAESFNALSVGGEVSVQVRRELYGALASSFSELATLPEPGGGGGSGVTSFNTRTGAVVPAAGDYDSFYFTETEVTALLSGKAAAVHTHGAGDITTGTMATARLGGGTANATTFLRGDQTWAAVPGLSDGDKGDITVSASGATWTIDNDAVTFAKIQNIATDRLVGRDTATSGDPEEIALAGSLVFTGSLTIQLSGDSASPGATMLYGTNGSGVKGWYAQPVGGGGVSDGDKGDITVSGSGTVWTVDNDAITYAKLQNVSATDRLLGRSTAGAGDVEEITCTAAGRALLDDADATAQRTTLGLGALATKATVATGDIDADAVTYAKIQNVSATDRLLGRDTAAAGDIEEITLTHSLEFTGSQGIHLVGDVAAPGNTMLYGTNASGVRGWYAQPAGGGGGTWTTIIKVADQSKVSGPALTADNTLITPSLGIGSYIIRLFAKFNSANATMDYQYDCNFTGTCTFTWRWQRHTPAGAVAGTDVSTETIGTGVVPATSVLATTFGIAVVEIEVHIVVTVAGVFQFRWGQVTSDAGALTCKKGGYLEYATA